jgi:hypothetical protein
VYGNQQIRHPRQDPQAPHAPYFCHAETALTQNQRDHAIARMVSLSGVETENHRASLPGSLARLLGLGEKHSG